MLANNAIVAVVIRDCDGYVLSSRLFSISRIRGMKIIIPKNEIFKISTKSNFFFSRIFIRIAKFNPEIKMIAKPKIILIILRRPISLSK